MAKAKQQVWYLARDGGVDGACVFSKHPLHNESGKGGRTNWMPGAPHDDKYVAIMYEVFNILAGGKYKLRLGAKPRKVVLTPLGVKEV